MKFIDYIYSKLPCWAQNYAVSLYAVYWHWLRFGYGYKEALQDYSQRNLFTAAEWEQWQKQRLEAILKIACKNVPYYAEHWDSLQKENALKGNLQNLPLLDKETIRREPRKFIRTDKKLWPQLTFHTSGSTGTPIAAIYSIRELRLSLAVREARSAQWAGVSFNLSRATFSGRLAVPKTDSKGPFHRFNAVEKQVYFSPFHLSPANAPQYVKALYEHQVQWLTGYAVSSYLLAKFILEQKLKTPKLKAVITTSEKLTLPMREVMEKAYGCKIYEEYSTVENSFFVSECEKGKLHASPDVGIIEILRPDGTACLPGEIGEVVVTCLMHEYQIFIRYRIGDIAAWDNENCPCGRQMPVLKEVMGRIEDVVMGPDGRQMVRFHGVFVGQQNICEGQIIQETLTQIRVKVVPSEGFGEKDKADITQKIQQRLGKEVQVIVEIVPSIPRTKAGKAKAVISYLEKTESK